MFTRILKPPHDKSFFLFGPRGTGKTTWLKKHFTKALYFDLLEAEMYNDLLANPSRLGHLIPPGWKDWVVIDEVQRVPAILHEVHRLIESRRLRFAMTGSSARQLARGKVNLLAGRALTLFMHPIMAAEMGGSFVLQQAIAVGQMPAIFTEKDPRHFLESYVSTYLREEVQQEGLTRNLGAFTRFLETASFSQAQILNISAVARECAVNRKVAENYFSILEDLLLATRIPVFTKRASRRLVAHPKFYFFDTGVFRAIRPRGALDTPEEIDGAALETAVFQEVRALNDYLRLGYKIFYWRTVAGQEVDLVLYGERGLIALEIKRSARLTSDSFKGLRAFLSDYPTAKAFCLYGGSRSSWEGKIRILPLTEFFKSAQTLLENK